MVARNFVPTSTATAFSRIIIYSYTIEHMEKGRENAFYKWKDLENKLSGRCEAK